MQKKFTTALTTASAAAAILFLAGCTAPADHKDPKPTQSQSAEEQPTEPEQSALECVDGVAKGELSNAVLTLDGGCESVEITGVNSLITITGPVAQLSVDGSINKVVVDDVAALTFVESSSGNTVETASTPEVTDNGAENEVVAPQ